VNEHDDSGRVRLFFCPPTGDADRVVGDRVWLDSQESRHLLQVLRTPTGGRLRLTDGCGALMAGRLVGSADGRAEIVLEAIAVDDDAIAAPRLVLACAVVKGRRFEWVVEKVVELGVHCLVPLLTDRAVIRPRRGKQQRWATLMRAALKQSGRSFLPSLAELTDLGTLLATDATGPRFWGAAPADPAAATVRPHPWPSLAERFGPGQPAADHSGPGATDCPATLTLMIGPEGGWSDAEYAALHSAGAEPVALGRHVLRTETAAIVGLLALQTLREAWLAG